MSLSSSVRLFLDHPLGAGQCVPLTREQAHYLFGVMRLGPGDSFAVFNGRDGEWRAEVREAGKRGGVLEAVAPLRPLALPPDLWLLFAPVKKARTDFIVEKAVEMGVRRILPVQTDFTNSERIRRDRLQAHATEAAEQCGATYVPDVADLAPLRRVLDGWPDNRPLMWGDEALAREPAARSPDDGGVAQTGAVLIGPEGGFSPAERERLAGFAPAFAVRLGPRILRADTAAVAALTLWQTRFGDWA